MSPLLSNCFSLLHSSEFDSVGASRVLCADSSSTFFKYLKSKLFRVNFNVVRVRSVRIVALFCTWSLRWCWVSDQQGRLPFDRVPQVHGQALVLSLIVSDQIVQGLKKRFAPLESVLSSACLKKSVGIHHLLFIDTQTQGPPNGLAVSDQISSILVLLAQKLLALLLADGAVEAHRQSRSHGEETAKRQGIHHHSEHLRSPGQPPCRAPGRCHGRSREVT